MVPRPNWMCPGTDWQSHILRACVVCFSKSLHKCVRDHKNLWQGMDRGLVVDDASEHVADLKFCFCKNWHDIIDRSNCHLAPLLHLWLSPLIRHLLPNSLEIRKHTLFIWQLEISEISRKTSTVSHHLMPQFWSATFQFPNSSAFRKQPVVTSLPSTACFTTVCRSSWSH